MWGNKEKIKIEVGQAVFGKRESFHETSTETASTAIVMEAENLEQAIANAYYSGEL